MHTVQGPYKSSKMTKGGVVPKTISSTRQASKTGSAAMAAAMSILKQKKG